MQLLVALEGRWIGDHNQKLLSLLHLLDTAYDTISRDRPV